MEVVEVDDAKQVAHTVSSMVEIKLTDDQLKVTVHRYAAASLIPFSVQKVEEFIRLVPEEIKANQEWFTRTTAVRFLRARKFDVQKALHMIVSCWNWRSKFTC